MVQPARPCRRTFLASGAACCAASAASQPLAAEEDTPRRFKRIDCHLHINHKRRSLADTIRHIEATGTDKAFILPLETGEGGVVLEAFEKYPDRIIPFC